MSLQYTLVQTDDDQQVISVFIPGEAPQVALSDHPNFGKIVEKVLSNDSDGLVELFDVSKSVAESFRYISERVSVANGRVYFDGDEVDNTLTKQILRFMDEELDFKPLVRFYEKVAQNPEPHSRENLYRWLDASDFTITYEGNILGYKGITMSDGIPVSIHSGKAIVDGEVKNGRIPNVEGSIIEMPRSEVAFDPAVGCSTGLHVGTWDYADSFGNGGVLEVIVNPRDVVSVPTDSGDQKLRCCRYEVLQLVSEPRESALADLDYEDEDYGWGDWEDGDEQ